MRSARPVALVRRGRNVLWLFVRRDRDVLWLWCGAAATSHPHGGTPVATVAGHRADAFRQTGIPKQSLALNWRWIMKHLDLEIEKLEDRIATWLPPVGVGIGVGVGVGSGTGSCGCSCD